jgi:hypothetical protein
LPACLPLVLALASQALLGTEVTNMVGQEEALLHGALRVLDGEVGGRAMAGWLARLRAAAQACGSEGCSVEV